MAMDFFEHQERAKKNTTKLVVLFIAATASIIALLYLVALVVLYYIEVRNNMTEFGPASGLRPFEWWNVQVFAGVTAVTLLIVFGGTAYKVSALRSGGRTIAESLGGRLIAPGTNNPNERKILNVVEEMAIASGVPVPPVYLLEREAGINAFAAGYTPNDAVIGVTRGTIELLDRDELQGVIAHEFSHILNGDMRLNIRLIGVVFGILVIGMIGQILMRSAFYGSRSSSRNKKDGGGTLLILAVGLAIFLIGSIGVFFGHLIKAAISRQREYLADAAAVQFTRNPGGIGDALKKIGGYTLGSKVIAPNAEEASHMYFAEGLSHILGFVMATHPPVAERIRRIDPSWDGSFQSITEPKFVEQKREAKIASLSRAAPLMGLVDSTPASATDTIGQPSAAHLAYARDLVASLTPALQEAAHEPYGARAVIFGLLLARDQTVRQGQLDHLAGNAEPQVYQLTRKLAADLDGMNPNARLPLIDLVTPALRELTPGQYQTLRKIIVALIRADERVDLFEWVLSRIILRHLDPHFSNETPRQTVHYYSLKPVVSVCATLLSALAYLGHADEEDARRAFMRGAAQLGISDITLQPRDAAGFSVLDKALLELDKVSPREKRKILAACAACISADRQVTLREGEVLRAIADALSCPMPPLLPGQLIA